MVDDSWMNAQERGLFEQALGLRDALKAREETCASERNVPKETVDSFRQLGLPRILQPKRYGGWQSSSLLLSRITEELATACASSAWVLSVFGEHTWFVAGFPEQAQEEVWGANPLAVVCSSLAPRSTAKKVAGGYQIDGTYPFASGCRHAEWLVIGAWVEENGQRELLDLLIPMTQVRIIDDWHVLGLAGTGSCTVALDGVVVPAHRALPDAAFRTGDTPGSRLHPDFHLLRAPRMAFNFFTQLPITLGLARLVLEHTASAMRGRISRGMTALAESQVVQCKLGEAAADIDAAIFVSHRRHRHVMDLVATGQKVSEGEALAAYRDSVWANKLAHQGITNLVSITCAEITHNRNRLQTWYRDALVTGTHFGANWEAVTAPYGRMLMGMTA
jgi:3-hydroxy-9,10-secoandrosta-1,3,5(10)-triene-9,17-dione monooxygenase